jgi:hypothetical protein
MAMTAQFTPGPWDALPKADYVHVAGKGHVAKITNPWNNRAEREANAHLIAAAPELYAALEEISQGAGAFNRDPLKHAENVIEEAKATALAALAKARGEQFKTGEIE